ncbi:hypothetical protein BpHYR1_027697 [Brachionus plicatilis]|uniref:Uncharacterized protein n=1 Tax=Brachionus plicatilis TaxID=10195 RepID=A0A3M7P4M4_BRAPC|nr:hypothetical protein BpHYR1_027697 [Brachionus plicatilis]
MLTGDNHNFIGLIIKTNLAVGIFSFHENNKSNRNEFKLRLIFYKLGQIELGLDLYEAVAGLEFISNTRLLNVAKKS